MRHATLSRRAAIITPGALLVGSAVAACAEAQTEPAPPDTRTLVAYFSRSGNTRVIAGILVRALNASLFEIQPADAYPADYEATVAQATRERDAGFEPPLASTVPDLAAHDTLFLGFPIWGGTAPPVIRSFLASHDLSGKTVRPFITHGGYGAGSSLQVLAGHAPRTDIRDAFVIEADQERRTLDQVNGWLGALSR